MLTEFKMLEEVRSVGTQVMYLAKSVEDSSNHLKVLNANIQKASESSNKSAVAMKYLTFALVFLGFAQVVVAGLAYWNEQSVVVAKRECYRAVLQTSDINLNYQSCLRNKGLSD